ncbi:hypothetical protein DyAD56_05020 [Dyella sp. AD56]|nr:hypothetical protein DyAD56_05020 [Dyella sp. AD56]
MVTKPSLGLLQNDAQAFHLCIASRSLDSKTNVFSRHACVPAQLLHSAHHV